MKFSLNLKETIATLAVVVFAFLTLNPSDIFMPSMFQMVACGLLFVATALFVGMVVRERSLDEREERHRAAAGRTGYLLGISVLLVGLVFETFSHAPVDPWLIAALVTMVLGKMFARAYKQEHE